MYSGSRQTSTTENFIKMVSNVNIKSLTILGKRSSLGVRIRLKGGTGGGNNPDLKIQTDIYIYIYIYICIYI